MQQLGGLFVTDADIAEAAREYVDARQAFVDAYDRTTTRVVLNETWARLFGLCRPCKKAET